MVETFFFEIPVYRTSREKYYAEMEEHLEREMFSGSEEQVALKRVFYKKEPDQKAIHLRNRYGGAWEFNEVIGHIRLHFLGTQIRGEYFRVAAKAIRRTRNKQFEWRTHKLAPEISIPFGASSAEIYRLVMQYVAACRVELKGRHLDVSVLETIGPYMNWKELLYAHNHSLQARRP